MTYQAILAASVLWLLAFAIERLSRVSMVPSVVALIGTGVAVKPTLAFFGLAIEGIAAVPLLGTVGLVLIVLEDAFDIELRWDRLRAAAVGFAMAGSSFFVCVAIFALFGALVLPLTPFQAIVLAVPFAIISSAVAIPSSGFLPQRGREFVVYESAA
jgi:cell volume regulation protein A